MARGKKKNQQSVESPLEEDVLVDETKTPEISVDSAVSFHLDPVEVEVQEESPIPAVTLARPMTIGSWFEKYESRNKQLSTKQIVALFCVDFDLPIFKETDFRRLSLTADPREICQTILNMKR